MNHELLLVVAIKCPTCGIAENGLLKMPRFAFEHPWYCVDCPASLPAEERRLMFATEPTEALRVVVK
jgi:hypothetical protein